MINVTKYLNSPDLLELYLNQTSVDLLSITQCIVSGPEEEVRYNDNLRKVKIMVNNMPLEFTVPTEELSDFLSNFNLEGRR